jgi:hypothetical protein
MEFFWEKPFDRLVTDRVQPFSGWFKSEFRGAIEACCEGARILIQEFPYPDDIDFERRGFWGLLFLQDLLPRIGRGSLEITVTVDGQRIGSLTLFVCPWARSAAKRFPVNEGRYAVRARNRPFSGKSPQTIVFPGLGAVGGTSFNYLFRLEMLQRGWDFPAYFEANDLDLWTSLSAGGARKLRWIDGHDCYAAAAQLPQSFARITLLRNPLRRMLSVYRFASLVHPYTYPFADLEEFVESDQFRSSTQSRSLLRLAGIQTPAGMPAEEEAEVAWEHLLRSYALIGITEKYEETIFLAALLGGYESIGMWWSILASPRTFREAEIPGRILRRMESLLESDWILYRRARRKLTEAVEAAGFGMELGRYQEDARRQKKLPDAFKMLECLRWRMLVHEEELQRLRRAVAGANQERGRWWNRRWDLFFRRKRRRFTL